MLKLNLMLATALAAVSVLAQAQAQAQVPAAAQTSAPAAVAAPSSPAKKEAAARVLVLMRPAIETLGAQLAQQPALQIQQRAAQAMQGVAADRREIVGREIEADLRKYVEETGPLMRERAVKLGPTTISPLLEERFSEDELRELITMLESPLNRRFQQSFPEMQRALAETLVAEMRAEIETRARALEQSVGKRLGVMAPAATTAPAAGPTPKK